MAHATHPARPLLAKLLLIVLSIAAIVTLSQCRNIADQVVGVSAGGWANAASCVSACATAYADSNRAESAIHVANVQACAGDETCLATEEARHEAAVARIAAGRTDCINGCHHQGAGRGGN